MTKRGRSLGSTTRTTGEHIGAMTMFIVLITAERSRMIDRSKSKIIDIILQILFIFGSMLFNSENWTTIFTVLHSTVEKSENDSNILIVDLV